MAWQDWLDWEVNAFRGLLGAWRRVRRRSPTRSARPGGASFEDHSTSLSVLAQVLTGEPVRLRPSAGVGGLRGADLLVPARLALDTDPDFNRDAYRVQIVVASGMRRLTRSRHAPASDRYEDALDALRLAREAVDLMTSELPRFGELHERVMARVLAAREPPEAFGATTREADLERARRAALAGERPWDDALVRERLVGPRTGRRRSPPVPIWGEWLSHAEDAIPGEPGEAAPAPEDEVTTEIDAPAVDALRRVELEPPEARASPPNAPVERVETLDRYRGGSRDLDGADELEAQLEALEQVEIGDLFRGNQTAQSLLKADLDLGAEIAEASSGTSRRGGIRYDEWDERRQAYRKGWCTVYPGQATRGDPGWASETLRTHRELVHRLRRKLEAHRVGLRPVYRQFDGEEIDLDAALDDRVTRQAGRPGDPRLYIRQRKRRRDFATTVLLDVSMSTDSWVAGRRILDVAREAALVLGEVADQLDDHLRILAFASETRKRCHVWQVFGEGEAWSEGKLRLAGLEPRGYTRIGPALRHATQELAATPAERRLLLLISDGKPTDYDRYEGRHGVSDVRQAIREAERLEIRSHALAIDAVARDYLPALFGEGGWHVLPTPDDLVESLTEVYGRLTAR